MQYNKTHNGTKLRYVNVVTFIFGFYMRTFKDCVIACSSVFIYLESEHFEVL